MVKRTGAEVPWTPGRDLWLDDELAKVGDDCPPEEMNAEDPLFILYTSGSTGKAQGRAAHLGRLSRVRRHDASICVRLPRRRHLLVHGRCRLGDGPLLYRLRAARQRRDHADVRGRAELSRRLALLAGGRQAQGQYFLHRADRDPGPDGRWATTTSSAPAGSRSSCSAPWASRSIPKRGSGTITWWATNAARSSIPGGRPRPAAFSSRRCPAPPSSSPARRRCRSSACSRPSSMPRATFWRARRPAIWSSSTPGRG